MTICVNDQTREVAADILLNEVVAALGLITSKGVAIAINDEVVPRSTWSTRRLIENDRLLVIQATQGG